jgi:hypothetical protein
MCRGVGLKCKDKFYKAELEMKKPLLQINYLYYRFKRRCFKTAIPSEPLIGIISKGLANSNTEAGFGSM